MLPVNRQTQSSLLVICAILCACEGSQPGLLGEYSTAISAEKPAAPEPEPTAQAGSPAPVTAASEPAAPSPVAAPPNTPVMPSSPPPALPVNTPAPPITPPRTLGKPDYVAVSNDHVDLAGGQESFFCLTLDLKLGDDTWITALELVPQHADSVFQATVGFSEQGNCDSLGLSTNNVFDYRPNNRRIELEPGDALRLPAHSTISVQLLHSTLGASAPPTDPNLTELRLWTLPKGERPEREVVRAPFHVFSIDIPVDAVDLAVTNTEEISAMYTRPGAEIIGVTTDMKYLGQTLEASVVAPDGTATTLLDVQDWSEDARKDYMFDPGKYIPVASGSAIEHTCTYSNRLEDQRLDASGKPMAPQRTVFGEDARAEMCRVSVWFRYPL